MKIDRMKDVVADTTARIATDVAPPVQPAASAQAVVSEALDLLKQRVDLTAPGQFEPPERMAERTLQLQADGRRVSRSELERTLGRDDLVDLNYFLRGLDAARSVGRIAIRDAGGAQRGDATGFLIAPGYLLTNHHVFPDATAAASGRVEFDCELDRLGFPRPTTTFGLEPARLFVADEALDFALVAVGPQPQNGQGVLADYGWLRISPEVAKINVGEPITIIQHPDGRAKQIALRENRLLDISEQHLTYESDTAPGSSGAPVFNDSWQVVGLHHSGVPRKDAEGRWLLRNGQPAGDEADDSEIDWIANEGVRASRIVERLLQLVPNGAARDVLEACCLGQMQPKPATETRIAGEASGTGPGSGPGVVVGQAASAAPQLATTFSVPLTVSISLGGPLGAGAVVQGGAVQGAALERTVEPWHDADYAGRTGYDPDFLGRAVRLPTLVDPSVAAAMTDGGTVVPYQNFSLVLHRLRRLPVFTASNVDGSVAAKEPEAGRIYTRKALGGLEEGDRERWFLDPRLPRGCQLPDRFFNNDRKAFDKGHLVRREEVCWGETYNQVRRANGDTYHVTNCTPQVQGFNQSRLSGVWGQLENLIEKQGLSERYCLLAGPVLADDDPVFIGVDDDGPVRIPVPRAYWKVVVARSGAKIQAFGFLLEQDLSQVAFEFDVAPLWRTRMVPLKALQTRIGLIRFSTAILNADQAAALGVT